MAHEESEWPVNKVVIEQGAAKVEVKKSNSELPDHFNHLYDERAMITINQEDPSFKPQTFLKLEKIHESSRVGASFRG